MTDLKSKRYEIIEILGGFKCNNCGIEDPRVLEIDHIFGDGKEMPLSDNNVLDMYLENPYNLKKSLQILCRNCHRIKSLTNGEVGRRKGEPKPITVKGKDIPQNILDHIEWYTDWILNSLLDQIINITNAYRNAWKDLITYRVGHTLSP